MTLLRFILITISFGTAVLSCDKKVGHEDDYVIFKVNPKADLFLFTGKIMMGQLLEVSII